MKQTAVLLLSFLLFSACHKSQQDQRMTGCFTTGARLVPLNNCAEEAGAAGDCLCFTELVEESRCPAYAICIWAGAAVGRFAVTLNGKQHRFSLSTATYPSYPPNDTTIDGVRFTLLNILPYPGSGNGPTKAEIKIN